MLLDKQNQFSADTGDNPTALGSTVSTNIIDLGIARDIGGAVTDQLMLLCQVATAFTSGGSATLQVQFQTAPDNGVAAALPSVVRKPGPANALRPLVMTLMPSRNRPTPPRTEIVVDIRGLSNALRQSRSDATSRGTVPRALSPVPSSSWRRLSGS